MGIDVNTTQPRFPDADDIPFGDEPVPVEASTKAHARHRHVPSEDDGFSGPRPYLAAGRC